MAKTIEKTVLLEDDEMKQIPSTIVLSILLLILAAWPNVDIWGEQSLPRHLLLHVCYLISGGLVGLQAAWWSTRGRTQYTNHEESRVSS